MSEEEQTDLIDFEEILPLDTSASVSVSVEAEALKICFAVNQYFADKPNAILNNKSVSLINECMN